MAIFDDDDDFGIDDFAFWLGAGEEIAQLERTNKVPDDPEPLIPEDDKEHWEKD